MDALGDARTGNREINYVTDPVGVLFRRLTEYFDAQQISAAFITPQMFRLYKGSRGMKRACRQREAQRRLQRGF